MKLFLRLLLNALALLAIANLVSGFSITGLYAALILAVLLGAFNYTIKPIILLFTLPINLITLGLFTFVINAGLLWLASTIVKGVEIDSLLAALFASIVLWVVNFIAQILLKDIE